MMFKLFDVQKAVHLSEREAVTVSVNLREGFVFRIDFVVTRNGAVPSWNLPPSPVNRDEPFWELWNTDVVEVFLAAPDFEPEGRPHYFEFQVSPSGAYFELEVIQPRKVTNLMIRTGVRHGTLQLDATKWVAWIELDLRKIGWSLPPENLRGGIFAALGDASDRRYYAAFLPQQQNPDFHLPEYFNSLLSHPSNSSSA